MSVAVLIPTYRRNASLARALASVLAQKTLPDEIVVVDNSPEGGARDTVMAIAENAAIAVRYVAETRPGVSNARNAGFAATDADMIAQLDDDESAEPGWLAGLLAARAALDAPVVFGPVIAEAPEAGRLKQAFMRRLYSRLGSETDQALDKPWGCGNALIDRAALTLPDPPFAAEANQVGGEDDILFGRLKRQGVRFGWAARAQVLEHVEDGRARWPHLLARSFAYGQGASQNCVGEDGVDWKGAGFWMAVGAGQAVVFGLAALPALALGVDRGAACIDKAVQGAGKLVWSERLGPRFYGREAA